MDETLKKPLRPIYHAVKNSSFGASLERIRQSLQETFPQIYFDVRSRIKGYDWLRRYPEWRQPEASLVNLQLPAYIDTILDVGCGNGRNLIPFRGKLKLHGIDLMSKDDIKWLIPPEEVEYQRCSVEEFVQKPSTDMSTTFVYSHNTLYLLSKKTQNDFYDFCKKCGCRNFLFEEFTSKSAHHTTEYFQLPPRDLPSNYSSFLKAMRLVRSSISK